MRKAYVVEYTMYRGSEVKWIDLLADNKFDAYSKATYDLIPKMEGKHPYSSWVASVTYQNGNFKRFNHHAGNAY